MRARSAENDLPTGVADGAYMAAMVMADLRRPRLMLLGDWWEPDTKEQAHRATLMAKARAGDAAAQRQLWRQYKCRIILAER